MRRESREPKSAAVTDSPSPPYVALRDYGTRGYERGQRIVKFAGIRATVYKRPDIANSSWFLRVFVSEEKAHYRVSLQTSNKEEAIKKAEKEIVELRGKVDRGEKIYSTSLADLVEKYAEQQEKRLAVGAIRRTTRKMQDYRIRLGMKFLCSRYPAGLQTKLSAIDGASFKEYLDWRRALVKERNGSIRNDVVRDELSTIRKMFAFARKEGLCTERNVPNNCDFEVEPPPTRKRISHDDYRTFIKRVGRWSKMGKNERDLYHRQLLHHFVLVVAHSGLRSGELFNLRNRDVDVRRHVDECVLSVRAETSKVKRPRTVTLNASGGGVEGPTKRINYLIRWIDRYQRHKAPGEFVFAPFESGSKVGRDVYYHYYRDLRKDLKEVNLEKFDTYHCRHFFITSKLYQGASIHSVARVAGTSTAQIERTYSHVSEEQMSREMGQVQLIYGRNGRGNRVVDLKGRK